MLGLKLNLLVKGALGSQFKTGNDFMSNQINYAINLIPRHALRI